MTREQYECLQALRFGLPISSTWLVWNELINRGWITQPVPGVVVSTAEFILTPLGEQALREFP